MRCIATRAGVFVPAGFMVNRETPSDVPSPRIEPAPVSTEPGAKASPAEQARAGQAGPAGAAGSHDGSGHGSLFALTLGSVGVVYGDIGTSPLYAFREALLAAVGSHHAQVTGPVAVPRETVLGVLSLIVWALLIVVTAKYVLILLRADNNGEGGTLSLMALAQRTLKKGRGVVLTLGVIGAAMFYGDSVITPAISVLSAVEGLKLITPAFSDYVVPCTVLILVLLFAVQSRGTAKVATFFGPVMVIWFITLAVGGVMHISDDPGVVMALDPTHGFFFLIEHKLIGARDARRGVPGRHRRRGALCRPRPFRPPADPVRLARARAAVPRAQLFRAGRADPGRSRPPSRTRSTGSSPIGR